MGYPTEAVDGQVALGATKIQFYGFGTTPSLFFIIMNLEDSTVASSFKKSSLIGKT